MVDRATFLELKLNDGNTVSLTLTFGRLLKLRQKKKEIYDRYNDLAMNGIKEELDFVTYLYVAYLCANIENLEECMTEEEFFERITPNHMEIVILANRLKIGGMKKKQDSAAPSKSESQKTE